MQVTPASFILLVATVIFINVPISETNKPNIYTKITDEYNDLSTAASRHNGRYSRQQKKKARKNTPDDYHYEYETKPESYSTSREYKSKPENYHVEIDLPPRSYSTSYHNSHSDRHKDSPSDAHYSRRNRGNSNTQNRKNSNRRNKDDDYDAPDLDQVDYYDADGDTSRTRGFSSDSNYNKEEKDDYQKSGKLDDDDDEYSNRKHGGGRSYRGQGGRGRNSRHGGSGNRNSNGRDYSSSNRHLDDDYEDQDRGRFANEYGDNNAKSYTSSNEY